MDLARAALLFLLTSVACYGQATSRILVTQIVNAAMSPHATNWNKIPTNVLDLYLTTNDVGTFAFRSAIGIQELTNVNLTSQSDGQALVWNNAAQKWTNATVTGGDVTTAQLNAASNAAILVATQQVNAASSWTNDAVFVRLIGLGFTNMIRINPTNGDIIAYKSSLDSDSPSAYQPGWRLFSSQRENDGAGSLVGTHVELYATNNTAEKLHHTVTIKRLGGLLVGTDLLEYGEGTAPWSFSTITVRSNFVSFGFTVRDQPSVMLMSPASVGTPYRFDTFTNSEHVSGVHTLWAWRGGAALGVGFDLMSLMTNGTLVVSNNVHIRGVPMVWPSANAAGRLTNDGSGNLSWVP